VTLPPLTEQVRLVLSAQSKGLLATQEEGGRRVRGAVPSGGWIGARTALWALMQLLFFVCEAQGGRCLSPVLVGAGDGGRSFIAVRSRIRRE
jgi:hypothetical protein